MGKDLEDLTKEELSKRKDSFKSSGDQAALISSMFCMFGTLFAYTLVKNENPGLFTYFASISSWALTMGYFTRACKCWKKFHEFEKKVDDYRR